MPACQVRITTLPCDLRGMSGAEDKPAYEVMASRSKSAGPLARRVHSIQRVNTKFGPVPPAPLRTPTSTSPRPIRESRWQLPPASSFALWFTESQANKIGRLALTTVNSHDFNADGKSDIAWRDTSGDAAVWLERRGAAAIRGTWLAARDADGGRSARL